MVFQTLTSEEDQIYLQTDTLPNTNYTFEIPKQLVGDSTIDSVIDWGAASYLPRSFNIYIPHYLVPVKTTGDGNCLLHATSILIWGHEHYHEKLRQLLLSELRSNINWYKSLIEYTEEEWERVIDSASWDGSYLEFIHIFALSNVIKRPILVYASELDCDKWGEGEGGVQATFIPSRFPPQEITKKPIAISWSSEKKNHFVPIVPVEGSQFSFTPPRLAYSRQLNQEEYIEVEYPTYPPPMLKLLKQNLENSVIINNGNQLIIVQKKKKDYSLTIRLPDSTYSSLSFDRDENIEKVALNFVREKNLSLEQMVFIRKHIKKYVKSQPGGSADKTTKKRKVAGEDKMKLVLSRKHYDLLLLHPSNLKNYSTSEYLNNAIQKILQFNDDPSLPSPLKLTNSDKADLQKVSLSLKDFSKPQFLLFFKLLKWPTPLIFPVIDLTRLIICIPKVANYYANNENGEGENIIDLVLFHVGQSKEKKLAINFRLALFFIANVMYMPQFTDLLAPYLPTVLNFLQLCFDLHSDDEKIATSALHLLLSLSVFMTKNNVPKAAKLRFVHFFIFNLNHRLFLHPDNITLFKIYLLSFGNLVAADKNFAVELAKLNIKQPIIDLLSLHDDQQYTQIVEEILTLFDDISFLTYFKYEEQLDVASLVDLVKALAVG